MDLHKIFDKNILDKIKVLIQYSISVNNDKIIEILSKIDYINKSLLSSYIKQTQINIDFLKNITSYIDCIFNKIKKENQDEEDKPEKILILSIIYIYFKYIYNIFLNDRRDDKYIYNHQVKERLIQIEKYSDPQDAMHSIQKQFSYKYENVINTLMIIIKELSILFCLSENKSVLSKIKTALSFSTTQKGGNNEFINYKYKDKTYKRKVRYDGKKTYIIINKERIYIKIRKNYS
jgi:hypothetical protein